MNKKLKQELKRHLVDSTAMQAAITPPIAAMEVGLAGMANDVSLNARLIGTGLVYVGLGSLFAKGRDLSRKVFKVTKKSSEKIKQIHDMAYASAYCLVIAPPLYYVSGERDIKKIAVGTLMQITGGAAIGGLVGYSVDAFRDLIGIEDSERLPELIRNQDGRVKKGLAALAVAGAIGATAGIYTLNSFIRR